MTLALRLGFIALVQAVILFSMVYERSVILRDGQTVILKTAPVDPRSLFRGFYVDLSYDISRLNTKSLEGDNEFKRHEAIYVALENRGDFWAATGLYHEAPMVVGEQVVLKGTVEWASSQDKGDVSIDYGIESYFIPEHDGKKIEAELRSRAGSDRVKIEVAVNEEGRGVIKGFYMDGTLLYKEKRL